MIGVKAGEAVVPGEKAGASRAALAKSAYQQIVVVTRTTQLQELQLRFNTVAQARFYLEHAGTDIQPILREHDIYQQALDIVRQSIPAGVKSQFIDRSYVPQFSFGEHDLVIAVGQDGLVVNVAKYLQCQPIVGVNPNPGSVEGVLLPYTVDKLARNLKAILQGKSEKQKVSMAQADSSDGQRLLAFNDIFVGPRSHISARYRLQQGDRDELQSSSGIIVSTGAGSTGWMKSILTGAAGIIRALGGQATLPGDSGRFDWDADYLVYAVREPWPSKTSAADTVFGIITPDQPLILQSYMADRGVAFSDGMESDYLGFNAGSSLKIRLADHKVNLLI